MITFIGEYVCKIDAKGRVVLPAAFKRKMAGEEAPSFVVKKDMYESCLEMFTMHEWDQQNKMLLRNINPYDPEHRQLTRDFRAGAVEVELDAANRFLLPSRLLRSASIEKEVVLVGHVCKIELWSPELYETAGGDASHKSDRAKKIMKNATYNTDEI